MHQPKYPVEDGTPWGVSHTRADMQKVRDAAAAYEPPAAVRSLPVFSVCPLPSSIRADDEAFCRNCRRRIV